MADNPNPFSPTPGAFSPTPGAFSPTPHFLQPDSHPQGALNPKAILARLNQIESQVQLLLNALDGGSTDQVLTKASGSDYDFTWSNATVGPDAPTAADMAAVNLSHSAIAAGTSLYNQVQDISTTLDQAGLSAEAIAAGTSLYQVNCGIASALNDATIDAVCNGDGTITVTLNLPSLPPAPPGC